MNANEITDRDSLKRWLEDRTGEDPAQGAVAIVQRAALRVFPIWAEAMDSEWAQNGKETVLRVLRALLTSGTKNGIPLPKGGILGGVSAAVDNRRDLGDASFDAGNAFSNFFEIADAPAAVKALASAAASAAYAADTAATSAEDSSAGAATAADFVDPAAMWREIRSDAAALLAGTDPAGHPLWSGPAPDWFTEADARGRAIWAADPELWSFWLRWWDGVLSGQQIPWEVQHDIALIPDADWAKGEAHVAGLIAGIEARHQLLAQVRLARAEILEFQEAMQAQGAALAHRWHNYPPELVDMEAEAQNALTTVQDALTDAESELVKPAPSPRKLRQFGKRLQQAIGAILTYCAKLADRVATKAADEFGTALGKWGAPFLLAYLATPTGTLQSVIKGLFELAR